MIPGLGPGSFTAPDTVQLAFIARLVVGAGRAIFTELRRFRAGAMMFLLGALVAGVAFGIGTLEAYFTGCLSLGH